MASDDTRSRSLRPGRADVLVLTGMSISLLVYHLITSTLPHYGYFIDELYYVACSKRLAFGYIDQPPLSLVILAATRRILGDSLPAIRFMPALALAGTVFLTGSITRRLGGTGMTVILASAAVIAMPVFLVMGSFYSMNAFEIVMIAALIYLSIRLVQDEDPRLWIAIGILIGLGLETKHTMVLYALALGCGVMLTPARRLLWNRWCAVGLLCCALLVVPNLLWQYAHGFPSLEFYRNAMVNKNIPTGPQGVLFAQVLFVNPFALPLWIAGLVYFLFIREARKYRYLGLAFLFLLLVMIVSQSSRPDRIAAFYPALFAGGAMALQGVRFARIGPAVRWSMLVLLMAGTAIVLPVFTPLMSPRATSAYCAKLGVSLSVESGKMHDPLPQWLGDRLGWRDLALEVSRVYHALPHDEQQRCVIISTNYGEAGALELYGPELGLPHVYATHNSFHEWGPPSDSITTYIGVFVNRRDLELRFDTVAEEGMQTCEYCTGPQQRIPIYVARGPQFSVRTAWPAFRIYN